MYISTTLLLCFNILIGALRDKRLHPTRIRGKTMKKVLLIIAGVVSIGLSIYCFNMNEGYYVIREVYGGAAYTGMQNAAAETGINVKCLAEIVRFGFGSVLMIGGLALIAFGIPEKEKVAKKQIEEPKTKEE